MVPRLPALLMALLTGTLLSTGQPAHLKLPETITGKRVAAYIAAFNSTDGAALKNFFQANFAEKALRELPIEQRLSRARQFQEVVGTVGLYRVVESKENRLQAIFQSSKEGWLEFTFEFEQEEPHGLLYIMVQPADDPDAPALKPFADEAAFLGATRGFLNGEAEKDEFSGVVLLAKGDSVYFLEAYGNADRQTGVRNTTGTRFNVGSINKSFTRVAILQLEAEGKLSLDDTIKKFLPDYPNRQAAEKVTVRQLLDMRSGIGDFFGERYAAAKKENIRSLKDYLPLFADKPLEFEPGQGTRYSNGGYIVLGLIIESVAGIDYYTYVQQNLFGPAGMTRSGWFEKSDLPGDIARGYAGRGRELNYETLPQRGSSAGGGYCTAEDLLRYVQALRTGVLRLPGSDGGLGIAGGAPGLNAVLDWVPARGYVVVVLSNFDPPSAERIARRIRRTLPDTPDSQ